MNSALVKSWPLFVTRTTTVSPPPGAGGLVHTSCWRPSARALRRSEHRGNHGRVAELAREALAVVEVRKGKARDGDVGPARDRAAPEGGGWGGSRTVESTTQVTHHTVSPRVDALDAEVLVPNPNPYPYL